MKNKTNESKTVRSNNASSKKTYALVMTALFTALTAVCAMITIPTTIPFTLQTLAVCLAGGILGFKRGTVSVIVYVLLGLVGMPVFSGLKSGPAVLMGPTGGYIIGFIFTAAIVGFFSDKFGTKLWIMAVSMTLGVFVCYVFGTIWFIVIYNNSKGSIDLIKVLSLCVFPFIIFDAVKIALAAVLTNRLKKYIK